ncbi:MAG: DUF4381 domain-containing protein [Gammaproteobacteria bacterium]
MTPGNQTAVQLRDIHLPPVPAFWPPAPGWWIITALAIVMAFWLWHKLRRHQALKKQCHEILSLLDAIDEQKSGLSAYVSNLSIFMRRLALMRYPQQQVASLTGEDWLAFLDKTGGKGQFSNGPGAILANGPYQADIAKIDTHALKKLVRRWATHNCRTSNGH